MEFMSGLSASQWNRLIFISFIYSLTALAARDLALSCMKIPKAPVHESYNMIFENFLNVTVSHQEVVFFMKVNSDAQPNRSPSSIQATYVFLLVFSILIWPSEAKTRFIRKQYFAPVIIISCQIISEIPNYHHLCWLFFFRILVIWLSNKSPHSAVLDSTRTVINNSCSFTMLPADILYKHYNSCQNNKIYSVK